jgi:hypothetical protein
MGFKFFSYYEKIYIYKKKLERTEDWLARKEAKELQKQ